MDYRAEARLRLVRTLKGEGAHLQFADAVGGFPESLMNTAPPNVPYTFWHQLEHIRITQWDILRYVVDPEHESPNWPAGYWPARDEHVAREAWDTTIRQYYADLKELVQLVENPETDVLSPVAHNKGRSVLGSVLIVADHTTYHLGEFVMGRQILGEWKSELD